MPIRRLALVAACVLAPALASAQSVTSYQFANGTLLLEGVFSPTGCGTYLCLNLEAGAGGAGIIVSAVGQRFTDAFARTGAVRYEYQVYSRFFNRSCSRTVPVFCEPDGGPLPFTGISGGPLPSVSYGLAVGDFQSYITYGVEVPAEVHFTAYDAAGAVVATDTFAPSIFVTPEPATLALTFGGLAVLAGVAVRRRGVA